MLSPGPVEYWVEVLIDQALGEVEPSLAWVDEKFALGTLRRIPGRKPLCFDCFLSLLARHLMREAWPMQWQDSSDERAVKRQACAAARATVLEALGLSDALDS